MRKKGWIALADTEDTRRKQVELTPAALAHFDQLSNCLLKAAQETR
jgi:DNA-binding MarR family transcriptional regulator